MAKSFFIGLLFTILFFICSSVFAVGLKCFLLLLFKKEPKVNKPVAKKRKPIKSIKIDPDEIDRIIVRKNG